MMRTKSFLGWLDEGSRLVSWAVIFEALFLKFYLVALDLTIFEIRPLNLESELLYRIINNNSPLAVNDPILMARGIF